MNFKKIGNILYYFFLAVIAFTILLFIGSMLPITGNYKIFAVLSGSMEPSIETGSIIIVKPQDQYRIGDVITFGESSKNKIPTTHRVIEFEVIEGQTAYITKGDANNARDAAKVSKNQILGKTVFNFPYVGYLVNFLKKPAGFIMVIVIPAAIVIVDEAINIWKEIKKGRKSEENPPAPPSSNS